jgi:hypothetical protein
MMGLMPEFKYGVGMRVRFVPCAHGGFPLTGRTCVVLRQRASHGIWPGYYVQVENPPKGFSGIAQSSGQEIEWVPNMIWVSEHKLGEIVT